MIRALIKKAHKDLLPLIPCDNTVRGYCEPESEHLPETECASTLILYFLPSISVVYKPSSVWYFA